MKMPWLRFAWKNVWRNRRRSMTTAGITAISVCGLLFFGGFVLYTYQSLEEFSARSQGHVLIGHAEYFDKEEEAPMSLGLDNWQQIRQQLQADEGVRRVLPRIQFSGLISNGEKSTIFIAEGVDARYEFTVSGPFLQVSQGDVLSPVSGDLPQVMLGLGVAKTLHAKVGDVLTLLSSTSEGALNGIDVEVVGTFGTGVPELDARKLVVGLDTAQALLNSPRVSTLSIYLRHTSNTLNYQQSITKRYPQLASRNWSDLAFFYHKVRDLYNRIFTVIGVVLVLVVMY
ncbi:MAG: ABC transporter permease, partial [Gammaproteobacteria bacterium]|nr:ABC transporter permease [Gammaproteobacteria bacterium]